MSRRKIQIVLLCEDRCQESFARKFLQEFGWTNRQIRVVISPEGRGSAYSFVENQYPLEVAALRGKPHIARALVVIVDADNLSVDQREKRLAGELDNFTLASRDASERIGLFIPKRNIETWLTFLDGVQVNEDTNYKRPSSHIKSCQNQATILADHCRKNNLPIAAPDSLKRACDEYKNRIARQSA